jgi:hypothetical protein
LLLPLCAASPQTQSKRDNQSCTETFETSEPEETFLLSEWITSGVCYSDRKLTNTDGEARTSGLSRVLASARPGTALTSCSSKLLQTSEFTWALDVMIIHCLATVEQI